MALGIGMGLGLDHALAGGGGGGGSAFEWTDHVPHADTITYYVSDSDGNDSNDGLSALTPKKTIGAAASLLRNNKPDWLLCKRGDVFAESLGWFVESINGYSDEFPVVFGTYGDTADPRPVIDAGSALGISLNLNHVSYVAVVGYDFFCSTHASGDNVDGATLHSTTGILFEDCRFRDLKSAITCANSFGAGRPSGLRFRRCQIYDIYLTTGGGIGVFSSETDGIEFEECLIDYCGWHSPSPAPGGFFHNTYFQHDCGPITFTRCISTRSSLEGINARPGGWLRYNFISGSPIGIGYSSGTIAYDYSSNHGEILGNVFEDPWESFGGLFWGIAVVTAEFVDISENIVQNNTLPLNDDFSFDLNSVSGPYGPTGCNDITLTDNIAYKCRSPFRIRNNGTGSDLTNITVSGNDIQEDAGFNATNGWGDSVTLGTLYINAYPGSVTFADNTWFTGRASGSWFNDGLGGLSSFASYMATIGDTTSTAGAKSYSDPGRTVADYMTSIGGTGGLAEFCDGARANRRYSWDDDYTAVAIINYIRDGYDLAPIA